VKKELVATNGFEQVSGFIANTLQVQQFPSTFSTLKTVEQVLLVGSPEQFLSQSFDVGILHGVPLLPHVNSIIGLVLHIKQFGPPPNTGRSQESRQPSGQAFC